ncbi:hypothetical protein ALC56_13392 [Trachymyrmex septentrionalis]|uniref:Uncharacterized protein n=1 Tax=Trachymyrmex septentrionalis TaxID=34720 RepID=A0A195EXC7_9HYME|nr:hypothetical protein ALC56_13392 [Trachymyrmex septentrionalis]
MTRGPAKGVPEFGISWYPAWRVRRGWRSAWGTSYDYHLTAYRTSTRAKSSIDVIVIIDRRTIRLADVRRRDSRVAIVLICDRLLATDSLTVKPKANDPRHSGMNAWLGRAFFK